MKIIIFFLLLAISIQVNSQSPDWIWANSAGGSNTDEGSSIATDSNGNVFVTGYFSSSSINFDSISLINSGNNDFFVVKYDVSGNVLWAKSAGGIYNELGRSITVDNFGNVIVTGSFNSSSITFGSFTLTKKGSYDIFVVKYDAFGNVLWARSDGGTNSDEGFGITTDAIGNVFVTGYFKNPSTSFDTITLINNGTWDIFVVKYNSLGNVLWARSAGGTVADEGRSISTDANGSVFITGYFASSSITFGTTTLTTAGGSDVFVAKYDSLGNFLWAKKGGGSDGDVAQSISADKIGNVYITGGFFGPDISFGSIVLTNTMTNYYEMFLVKYDSFGNLLWAKSWGGAKTEWGSGICTNSDGEIFVTGICSSPSITFGAYTINTSGSGDIFVIKCDQNGNILWAKSTGSSGSDFPYGISIDYMDNILITGSFDSPTINFGSTILVNPNTTSDDIFVAKLDRCTPAPPSICLVTVDSLSLNNIIVWDKPITAAIDSFIIYRDTANDNYARIGAVPYDSLSQFIDTVRSLYLANGDPNASSWRYKLAVLDTCGTLSAMSPYHQTLFMINNGGTFIWTHYQIEGENIPVPGLTNYIFQRDDYSNGNWLTVQTLSASSTLYNDPQFSSFPNASYRVMTQWSTQCTATKSSVDYNSSRSNVKAIAPPGNVKELSLENAISIYPNPNDGTFTIELNNSITQSPNNSITIYNVLGEEVHHSNLNSKQKTFNLKLIPGIYQLKLKTNSETVNKKIIVE